MRGICCNIREFLESFCVKFKNAKNIKNNNVHYFEHIYGNFSHNFNDKSPIKIEVIDFFWIRRLLF